MFGNEFKQIQDDLRKITHSFDSIIFQCLKKEILIGRDFLEFAEKHKDEDGVR